MAMHTSSVGRKERPRPMLLPKRTKLAPVPSPPDTLMASSCRMTGRLGRSQSHSFLSLQWEPCGSWWKGPLLTRRHHSYHQHWISQGTTAAPSAAELLTFWRDDAGHLICSKKEQSHISIMVLERSNLCLGEGKQIKSYMCQGKCWIPSLLEIYPIHHLSTL